DPAGPRLYSEGGGEPVPPRGAGDPPGRHARGAPGRLSPVPPAHRPGAGYRAVPPAVGRPDRRLGAGPDPEPGIRPGVARDRPAVDQPDELARGAERPRIRETVAPRGNQPILAQGEATDPPSHAERGNEAISLVATVSNQGGSPAMTIRMIVAAATLVVLAALG